MVNMDITAEIMTEDLRGITCPTALLMMLKQINCHKEQIRGGSVRLEFMTDSQDLLITIPEMLDSMGYGVKFDVCDDFSRVVIGQLS